MTIYEALLCPECDRAELEITSQNIMTCPECRAVWGVLQDRDTGKWLWARHPDRKPEVVAGELADKELGS